jgi:hypothetical protein
MFPKKYLISSPSPGTSIDKHAVSRLPKNIALGVTFSGDPLAEPIKVHPAPVPKQDTHILEISKVPMIGRPMIAAAAGPGVKRHLLTIVNIESPTHAENEPGCPDGMNCVTDDWSFDDTSHDGQVLENLKLAHTAGYWAVFQDSGKDYTLYWLNKEAADGDLVEQRVDVDLVA